MEKPNLDLLRSMAVIAVVADHAFTYKGVGGWLTVGLFGVYVFFVHTALVLMWSLERNSNTLNFYVRRAFRIYPFAVVIILATFILGFPPNWGNEANYHPLDRGPVLGLLENVALVQNLYGDRSIAGVTWSLGPEIDMYILLPVLFTFARRERSIWTLLLIWGLSVAFAHKIYPGQIGNPFPVLIPHFIAGVIAYVGFRIWRPVLHAALLPVWLVVLGAPVVRFPGHRVDWWACLALGLTLPLFRQVGNAQVRALSKTLAKYSYGIYLTHPFGMYFGIQCLHGRSPWIQIPILLVTTTIMSYVGYHLIERRFIDSGKTIAAWVQRRVGADDLNLAA